MLASPSSIDIGMYSESMHFHLIVSFEIHLLVLHLHSAVQWTNEGNLHPAMIIGGFFFFFFFKNPDKLRTLMKKGSRHPAEV